MISPVDPRRARTNAIADVRFCAALRSEGHDVEWIVPSVGLKQGIDEERILSLHEVPYRFDLRVIVTPQRDGPRDLGRILPLVLGQLRAHRRRPYDYVISRDLRLLLPILLSRQRNRAVPWLHEYRGERWERIACRRASGVLATNSAIVQDLRADVPTARTFVTGNPIFRERVVGDPHAAQKAARLELGLVHSPLIVYTGKVYPGMREIEYLFHAAERLLSSRFVITGGQPAAIIELRDVLRRRGIENVDLTGFFEKPEFTRLYQQAADVLTSYYSTRDHLHAHHNLPNKLAEYMATGNPVVVADFPAVREWATPETAALVDPDNPEALVNALQALLDDPDHAAQIGHAGRRLVAGRPFERVAQDVTQFLASDER